MDGKDTASYAYYTAMGTFLAACAAGGNPMVLNLARTGFLVSGMLLCSPAQIGAAANEAREVAVKIGTASGDLIKLLSEVSEEEWSKMGREAVEATVQSFVKQGKNTENIWQAMADTLDQFNGGTQVVGYVLVTLAIATLTLALLSTFTKATGPFSVGFDLTTIPATKKIQTVLVKLLSSTKLMFGAGTAAAIALLALRSPGSDFQSAAMPSDPSKIPTFTQVVIPDLPKEMPKTTGSGTPGAPGSTTSQGSGTPKATQGAPTA